MSWNGQFHGAYFGNWFGSWTAPLVEYAGRAKRGFSYVLTQIQELFVETKQAMTTVKTRGRQD